MSGERRDSYSELVGGVRCLLVQRGWGEVPSHNYFSMCSFGRPVFSFDVQLGVKWDGGVRKVNLAMCSRDWPSHLVVDLKNQKSEGSVEMKLPGIAMGFGDNGHPSVFVLEGTGRDAGVAGALRRRFVGRGNLLGVFSLLEFGAWLDGGASEGRDWVGDVKVVKGVGGGLFEGDGGA